MWGLFARKPIPANEFVIEYVGELIRRTVNDVRERIDADSDYRFRVDAQWVVDATRRVCPLFLPLGALIPWASCAIERYGSPSYVGRPYVPWARDGVSE